MKLGKLKVSLLTLLILVAGLSIAIGMIAHTKTCVLEYEVSIPVQVTPDPIYYEALGEWQHQVRPTTRVQKEKRTAVVKQIGWPLTHNQTSESKPFTLNETRWLNLLLDLCVPVLITVVAISASTLVRTKNKRQSKNKR